MISIEIQSEDGQTLRQFPDPDVMAAIGDHPGPQSACLQFIDPHGDTIFNRLQVPVLVAELRALERSLGADLRMRVHALATFAEEASQEPHQYLRFIGE